MEFRITRGVLFLAFVICAFWMITGSEFELRPLLGAVVFGAASMAMWWSEVRVHAEDLANRRTDARRREEERQKQIPSRQPYQLYQQPSIDLPPTPNPAPPALPPTQNQDF